MDILTVSRSCASDHWFLSHSPLIYNLLYFPPPLCRWPPGFPRSGCDLSCRCSLPDRLNPQSAETFSNDTGAIRAPGSHSHRHIQLQLGSSFTRWPWRLYRAPSPGSGGSRCGRSEGLRQVWGGPALLFHRVSAAISPINCLGAIE